MKSFDDLLKLKEKLDEQSDDDKIQILVGLATCGISAGAKPVMESLIEKIKELKLENVVVKQTGCIGICRLEPMFEVYSLDGSRTTYVDMNSEKAKEVVEQHILKGHVIDKYTIGAYD